MTNPCPVTGCEFKQSTNWLEMDLNIKYNEKADECAVNGFF